MKIPVSQYLGQWGNDREIDPDLLELNTQIWQPTPTDAPHQEQLEVLEPIALYMGESPIVKDSRKYATKPFQNIRDRYGSGGFTIEGINPITGKNSEYPRFRPITPFRYFDSRKGKEVEDKYLSPTGSSAQDFYARVPFSLALTIANRHGITYDRAEGDYQGFWAWVKDNALQIVYPEGEGDALAVLSRGYVAIGVPGHHMAFQRGTIEFRDEFKWILSGGSPVVIAFDRDEKPKTIAEVDYSRRKVSKALTKLGNTATIAYWNPAAGKGAGDIHPKVLEMAIVESKPLQTKEKKEEKRSIADVLLDVAREHCDLWHTPDGQGFADIAQGDGIRQTFPLNSSEFRKWLTIAFVDLFDRSPSKDALAQCSSTLEALAWKGEERQAFNRVAEHDGSIYIDLGTQTWEAVKVSPDGWEIVKDAPVRFRRAGSQLSLPLPERGGNLNKLREFFSFEDQSWVMLACWILYGFTVGSPYPITILHGSAGCGKSTLTKALKQLIDPNKAPLVGKVGDERNFAIMANNAHVMAFDNLSGLTSEQSDMLCTAATGGGFRTRTLHTNDEETVISFRRPILINGIDSIATRGDLLDRAMLISLSKPSKRREESIFWNEFNNAHPKIFGAMCDALVIGLKNLPQVNVPSDTRMMDFARFGIALEPALGLNDGDFMRLYLNTKQEAHEVAIEASPLAQAIRELVIDREEGFTGTATDLLRRLESLRSPEEIAVLKKDRRWPADPARLSKAMGRIEPDLLACGVEYTTSKGTGRNRTRLLFLKKLASDGTRTVSEASDSNDNSPSEVKPLHSKTSDSADGTDGKNATYPEPVKINPGQWVFYQGRDGKDIYGKSIGALFAMSKLKVIESNPDRTIVEKGTDRVCLYTGDLQIAA